MFKLLCLVQSGVGQGSPIPAEVLLKVSQQLGRTPSTTPNLMGSS